MIAAPRTFLTPRANFVLRPEQPDDERFLFDLFVFDNIGKLQSGGFPKETIEQLINFQFRSQTKTYRSMFPDAIYSIVSVEGKDIGRFIEHDETDVVYFVDFVLLPEYQAMGFGAALTRALMDEWAARGRGTRVKVLINNDPCLKMCRKLGFVQSAPDEMAYVELRWYPPHLTQKAAD
jgi:ribosomal protein S18 acetylase RimI-like enzyme